jgi:hypothetical protein
VGGVQSLAAREVEISRARVYKQLFSEVATLDEAENAKSWVSVLLALAKLIQHFAHIKIVFSHLPSH